MSSSIRTCKINKKHIWLTGWIRFLMSQKSSIRYTFYSSQLILCHLSQCNTMGKNQLSFARIYQLVLKTYILARRPVKIFTNTNIGDHSDMYSQMPNTGGPPLTRKSLTRFPLTRFLAYVRVSGGISVSRGPQYSPTNTSFM